MIFSNLLASLLILVLYWDAYLASIMNLTTSNLAQRNEYSGIITGNENSVFLKGKLKNRQLNTNFAGTNTSDSEIPEQKYTPAGEDIKTAKMELQIAGLIIKTTTTAISNNKIHTPKITTKITSPAITLEPSTTMTIKSDAIKRGADKESKIEKKIRMPVKLNMRQGLIMNQILSTYGLSDVNNSLCRNHVNEFKTALRALEPWALKMFDSSSKLMSGILAGNIAELGSFWQCLNINEETVHGQLRGRHCMLHVEPTDKLLKIIVDYRKEIPWKHFQNLKANILDGVKLRWSVCVPNSCGRDEVFRHFNKSIIEVTEGLNLTLSLAEEHCVSIEDLPEFTTGDYIYIFCVSLLVIVVAVCSIIDMASEGEPREVIDLFSLKRNANILFSTRENNNEITCLHGLRFLSMYFIVYGHRYIHNMATPVVNYMDLIDWLQSYYSTTVHGGTLTVDTFFLVSSTLLSYTYFSMIAKGIKINFFLFYLNRHLRLLVPLALATGTYATVVKHFGSGPLYRDFRVYMGVSCGYFWWSVLLYIQPFVNPRLMCIIQTWYLSVDMFWYYFAPFILLTLAKSQMTGYILLLAIYVCCTVTNFYVAWIHEFNGQMPVTPGILSTDYFALHYVQPVIRGGPYLLGLAFGHALFRIKDQLIRMSAFTKTAGWVLVSVCLPTLVLMSRLFHLEDFEYNRVFSSMFLACHRSIWTFGIMWIIWCCQHGHGGLVNSLLSCNMFKILGRVCYNIFLFHYIFQAAMQNSVKAPSYFSDFLSTYNSFSDMVLMILLGIPLTLCFEYPFSRMCGLLFKAKSSTIKIKPQDDNKI